MKLLNAILALLAALTLSKASGADEIFYETGFEAPTFDPSQLIRGQDDWEMWHHGEALSISGTHPNSGTYALLIDGELLEPTGQGSARAYCFYKSINEKTGDQTPPIVLLEVDARLDGTRTGTNGTPAEDIMSANFLAVVPRPEGEGQLLAGFFVSSTGHIWTYSSVAADNYKYSVPYTFGTYRRLGLRVDFLARTMTYLVDGTTLGTLPFPNSITTDQLISGYLELHGQDEPVETPDYNYNRAGYQAYFDNYRITFITPSVTATAIRFSQDLYLADEYARKAEIKLERTGSLEAPVRVKLTASDGTALPGEDYDGAVHSVTLPSGQKTIQVVIPLFDDNVPEPDKTFKITLSDLPNGATSLRKEATVILRDNERPGSIDPTWFSDFGLTRAADQYTIPTAFVVEPDGQLILSVLRVRSTVTSWGPVDNTLVRINPDGSRDRTLARQIKQGFDTYVFKAPDGKLILAEHTPSASPEGGAHILSRINADGSTDDSFAASIRGSYPFVTSLSGGKMLITAFGDPALVEPISVDGEEANPILRLNSNGSIDTSFSPPAGLSHFAVDSNAGQPLAQVLPDGKILLPVNESTNILHRIHPDGSIDTSFQTGLAAHVEGRSPYVSGLRVQPDGKIIVAGTFQTYLGQTKNCIVRLQPNGALDDTFRTGLGATRTENGNPNQPGDIWSCILLPSGHVLVTGDFDAFNGEAVAKYESKAPSGSDFVTPPILLNPDGTRNRDFEMSLVITGSRADGPTLRFPTPLGVADGKLIVSLGWGLGRLNIPQPEVPTLPTNVVQQAYLKASNAQGSSSGGDQFGWAAAVSGTTLVVGAPWEGSNARGVDGNQNDNSARGAGAAYVFVRQGSTWRQQAYLKASNTEESQNPGFNIVHNDTFGWSVAIDGDTIVVGARDEQSGATGVNGDPSDNSAGVAGAAYIFVRTGETWTQQAYLKASNTESGDSFGGSVAISGNTVVVGAEGEDSGVGGVNPASENSDAKDSGAAYVFTRTGTVWSQQALLKASHPEGGPVNDANPLGGDRFGYAVAISGDTVVVGAIGEDGNGTGVSGDPTNNAIKDSGAAYIFIRNGTAWSQQAYLKAINTSAGMTFGSAVAVSSNTVVVGANTANRNQTSTEPGSADVFVRDGTAWAHQAQLKPSNAQANDWFGSSVSVEGDLILIGAPQENSNGIGINGEQNNRNAEYSGAAFLYRREGRSWTQKAYLKASNAEGGDVFGTSVGLSGGTAVVGAAYEASNAKGVNGNQANNDAYEAGAAYVFTLPVTPPEPLRPGSLDPTWASTMGVPLEDLPYVDVRPIIPLPDGKMIVCVAVYDRDFTYPLYRQIVRLHADGSVDPTFPIRTALPDHQQGGHFLDPRAVAMPDGGVLAWDSGSDGTTFQGYRFRWRILADGSLDERWPEITSPSGGSFEFTPQPDGKVLVSDPTAPIFLNDLLMPWLFRLNADGTVDSSFTATTSVKGYPTLLRDGKVLIVTAGENPNRLRRLNPDGTLDTTFDPPASLFPVTSYRIRPLSTGQLLVAAGTKFHRIQADGSIDPTFTTGIIGLGIRESGVERIEVLEDGRIQLFGFFKSFNGVTVNGIVRLEANGLVDTSFRSGSGFRWSQANPADLIGVYEVHPLPGDRFLIAGGNHDTYDGQRVTAPWIMNADGTRDATFSVPQVEMPWGLDNVFLFGVVDGKPIVHAGTGPARLIMPTLTPVDTEITFAQDTFLADEFSTTATITLRRAKALDVPVTVRVTPSEDTAKAGEDYLAGSIEVRFNAGETNKVLLIPLTPDDAQSETDKTFKLTLANLPFGATSAKREARVVIRDNERPGSIDSTWRLDWKASLKPNQFTTIDDLAPRPEGKLDVWYQVQDDPEGVRPPVSSHWVRLNPDGTEDSTFTPTSISGYQPSPLEHFVPTADGKWLVVQNVANSVQVRLSGRVNADGSHDSAFTAHVTAGYITARQMVIPLANGDTWVSDGSVQKEVLYNGRRLPAPIRLNQDGSLDETFKRGDLGTGFILALAPQPHGQLLVQMSDKRFHRLNPDGSRDETFRWDIVLETDNPSQGGGAINYLNPMLPMPDGKVVLYGHFQRFNGREVNSIVRLNPDGSIDLGFKTGRGFTNPQDGRPAQVGGIPISLPEGRILFTDVRHFDGQNVNGPLVLNPDGSRMDAFELSRIDMSPLGFQEPAIPSHLISTQDGRLYFDTYAGVGRLNLEMPAEDRPRLSLNRDGIGTTRVTLKVKTGRRYTLQSSSDLRAWADLKSETATGETLEFSEVPISEGIRFYRVMVAP